MWRSLITSQHGGQTPGEPGSSAQLSPSLPAVSCHGTPAHPRPSESPLPPARWAVLGDVASRMPTCSRWFLKDWGGVGDESRPWRLALQTHRDFVGGVSPPRSPLTSVRLSPSVAAQEGASCCPACRPPPSAACWAAGSRGCPGNSPSQLPGHSTVCRGVGSRSYCRPWLSFPLSEAALSPSAGRWKSVPIHDRPCFHLQTQLLF